MKHLRKHFSGDIEGVEARERKRQRRPPVPNPASLQACLQPKLQTKVSAAAGTQTVSSHKLQINAGKGLLLPPALATQQSCVHTKLGVTTASAINKVGMRHHPVSLSTDERFRLGAHPVIAKGRRGRTPR